MPETKPNMQRKHYQWLAEFVAELPKDHQDVVEDRLVDALCEICPNFDQERFRAKIRDLE